MNQTAVSAAGAALPLGAVRDFYRDLTPARLQTLEQVYHPDIVFTDPAGSLRGADQLRRHFERLLENTRRCSCEFTGEIQCARSGSAALFWRMTLVIPRLAGGEPFYADGASHLQYQDGLIIAHRDYFDLGALLYEQLPLLGRLIRRLRGRMAPQD